MSKNEKYNEQRMQKKKQNNQKGQINLLETSPLVTLIGYDRRK